VAEKQEATERTDEATVYVAYVYSGSRKKESFRLEGALSADLLDIFGHPDVRITVKPCQKIDNDYYARSK